MQLSQWLVLSQMLLLPLAHSKTFRFTNVECKNLDPTFTEIKKCNLKVLKRGVIAFNMHVVLFKPPVNNVSVQVMVLRKSNVYRTFIDHTADYCHYMRNRQAYPLAYLFHNQFIDVTNINHTCPYEDDLIIDNLIIDQNKMKDIPLPNGDYMFKVRIAAHKVWRGEIKLFITQND